MHVFDWLRVDMKKIEKTKKKKMIRNLKILYGVKSPEAEKQTIKLSVRLFFRCRFIFKTLNIHILVTCTLA